MTDSLFKLDPLLPYWSLAVIFVITSALLIGFEIKKTNRFKALRIICVFLLTLSVLGLSLQPKILTQKFGFAILLTDNVSAQRTDSLENKFPGAKLYSTEKHSKATLISPNEIPGEMKVIAGNGLNGAGRDVLENKSFSYIPSPIPAGIIRLTLPVHAKAHAPSTISGVYNGIDSAKIILEGPGGKEDSVLISQKGITQFNLSFTPRQPGNFNYSISINGKKETIPVKVDSEKQMKILFIQMFPTFETGYLKNNLATDHKLVFRYQLSKNNFRYEYINHPSIQVDRLTIGILQSFDLVVVDTDAFKLLSSSEKKNLEASISSGLGVLVLFNENPKSNSSLKSFLPVTFKPVQKDTAHFVLSKKISLPVWPVKVVDDGKMIPTLKNNEGILAGYSYKGFGKIGFQLLQETYKLTLEGDSSVYKNLWSSILQKNARTPSENFKIKVENDFPIYKNEPVEILVISSTPPALIHNGIQVAMAEDALIDDLWKTKVWPDNFGWQEVQISGDSVKYSYYVSKAGDWETLATANNIRATKAMATSKSFNANSSWEYKPFAPWIFYLMFLVCAAVLWLVPKI